VPRNGTRGSAINDVKERKGGSAKKTQPAARMQATCAREEAVCRKARATGIEVSPGRGGLFDEAAPPSAARRRFRL